MRGAPAGLPPSGHSSPAAPRLADAHGAARFAKVARCGYAYPPEARPARGTRHAAERCAGRVGPGPDPCQAPGHRGLAGCCAPPSALVSIPVRFARWRGALGLAQVGVPKPCDNWCPRTAPLHAAGPAGKVRLPPAETEQASRGGRRSAAPDRVSTAVVIRWGGCRAWVRSRSREVWQRCDCDRRIPALISSRTAAIIPRGAHCTPRRNPGPSWPGNGFRNSSLESVPTPARNWGRGHSTSPPCPVQAARGRVGLCAPHAGAGAGPWSQATGSSPGPVDLRGADVDRPGVLRHPGRPRPSQAEAGVQPVQPLPSFAQLTRRRITSRGQDRQSRLRLSWLLRYVSS